MDLRQNIMKNSSKSTFNSLLRFKKEINRLKEILYDNNKMKSLKSSDRKFLKQYFSIFDSILFSRESLISLTDSQLKDLLGFTQHAAQDLTTLNTLFEDESEVSKNESHILSHLDTMLSSYNRLIHFIGPLLAISNSDLISNNQSVLDYSEKIEVIEVELQKVINTIEAAKSAATSAGTFTHEQFFNKLANEYNRVSQMWFIFSFLVCGSIFTLLYFCYENRMNFLAEIKDLPIHEIIFAFYLTKISALFLLFYALFFCTKNYKASRHNYILNKHRATAAQTFLAFYESTADDTTKNGVLLQATSAIFSFQGTGYNDESVSKDSPINTLIEVLKNTTKK